MSFCANCGRQRNESARFCDGCGAEFSDSPSAADEQASPAADAAGEAPPSDATRMDITPEVTRIEPPAPKTDPFAGWYQQEPPGGRNEADPTWQPTQTVQAAPTQPAGYGASGFTPANPFSSASPVVPPPSPYPPASSYPPASPYPPGPPAGPPDRGGKRALFIVLAVIVVLAAGGGAYALATKLGKHSAAQPSAQPTAGGPSSGASSPTAGASQQASSPAASASPSPTPSPALSLVRISPDVPASAAQPQVETLLSHYFHGINSHDYAEYAGTLNAEQRAKQTQSQFDSGYSSTTDSGMTLTRLTDSGNGGLTATVTFTSRQSPAQSIDHRSCNAWTLNLYLVPQGTGYLIGSAPSGYQPTYSDC
jgi:hypothetical protein